MKKFFGAGFFAGAFFAVLIIILGYWQKTLSAGTLLYEDELSETAGYEELSDGQKKRIEDLKGSFQIGEIVVYNSNFNNEWYENHDDMLIKQEIIFKDINDVSFLGESYQVKRIFSNDAYYYFGLRYFNAELCFGKKEVVEIVYQSLDDSWNGFMLILAANGNMFFRPGELVNFGHGTYTSWGMYEILPCADVDI